MGGVIPFAAGGGVKLPPDSLINMDGEPLTGKIDVSLTYVDPTDTNQLNAAPGDYQAKMLDGTKSLIESSGMFELFIDDGKGRPGGFVDGAIAEVEYPISMSSLKTAANATPMFSWSVQITWWRMAVAPRSAPRCRSSPPGCASCRCRFVPSPTGRRSLLAAWRTFRAATPESRLSSGPHRMKPGSMP